jgi:tetratricopeptide (TPR) repeat protein
MNSAVRSFCFIVCWGASLVLPLSASQPLASQEQQSGATAQRELTAEERLELRGDVFMARKQYGEAIDAYKELLNALGYKESGFWGKLFGGSGDRRNRKTAAVLNKIGICYQQLGDFRNAKKYYKRSMKQDETFYNPVNNLGTVYYHEEDYNDAIKYYKKAAQIEPRVATIYSNLGHAYFARKKYEESLAAFVYALQLDPQLFERRSQAGSLVQHGLAGDRPLFYFFLAKSYARMGDVERCAYYLRKARDEGYEHLADVERDPDFAKYLQDPLIQQVLHPAERTAAAPVPPPLR